MPPYVGKQPVQGFSGVLGGPRKDVFKFLVDNGFGSQANSADALLRSYALHILWRSPKGGRGTIEPSDLDVWRRTRAGVRQHRVPEDPSAVLAGERRRR